MGVKDSTVLICFWREEDLITARPVLSRADMVDHALELLGIARS